MGKKLTIGIGAAFAVFVIVFCAVPLKQVSYAATEKYQAPETYYTPEPYTERIPYIVYEPYTVKEPYTVQESYIVRKKVTYFDEELGKEVTKLVPTTKYRDVTRYRPVLKYREVTKYQEVTLYQDATGQTNVWQERPATQYKKVSLLEYLIGY